MARGGRRRCRLSAAFSLGYALQVSSGFYHPIALDLLTIAIGCTALRTDGLAGPSCRRPGRRRSRCGRSGDWASTVNFVMLATMPIAFYLGEPPPSAHPQFLAGLAVAFVLLTLIIVDPPGRHVRWFPLLLVTFAALGVWMIRSSANPPDRCHYGSPRGNRGVCPRSKARTA